MQRFLHMLLAGAFAGLVAGALVAWVAGGTGEEILWLATGAGMLGVAVGAFLGMTRTGAFRD